MRWVELGIGLKDPSGLKDPVGQQDPRRLDDPVGPTGSEILKGCHPVGPSTQGQNQRGELSKQALSNTSLSRSKRNVLTMFEGYKWGHSGPFDLCKKLILIMMTCLSCSLCCGFVAWGPLRHLALCNRALSELVGSPSQLAHVPEC